MKCSTEGCSNVGLRMGTRGRVYCGSHKSKAWDQVRKDGEAVDSRHQCDWEDKRLELHQEHLSRAV